jgi:hypothetical protein
MPCLTKADFLKPRNLRTTKVAVGSDYVMLRELTAPELFFLQERQKLEDIPHLEFAYLLLHYSMIDEQEHPLFESVEELKKAPIGVSLVLHLAEEVLKLSAPPESKN